MEIVETRIFFVYLVGFLDEKPIVGYNRFI